MSIAWALASTLAHWLPTCTIRFSLRAASMMASPSSHGMRHRLFDVDILARCNGVEGHLLVPVIGHGDDDSLHVLVVEQLPVIAAGREVRSYQLARSLEVRVVRVGDLDDARVRDGPGAAEENLPADADADDAHADAVVRADDGRVRPDANAGASATAAAAWAVVLMKSRRDDECPI